jgi:hypothetical protein
MAMVGDLGCRFAGVNPPAELVYLSLTTNFSEGLTMKIHG